MSQLKREKTIIDRFLEALQELGKLLRPNTPAPMPVPVRNDKHNRKR